MVEARIGIAFGFLTVVLDRVETARFGSTTVDRIDSVLYLRLPWPIYIEVVSRVTVANTRPIVPFSFSFESLDPPAGGLSVTGIVSSRTCQEKTRLAYAVHIDGKGREGIGKKEWKSGMRRSDLGHTPPRLFK